MKDSVFVYAIIAQFCVIVGLTVLNNRTSSRVASLSQRLNRQIEYCSTIAKQRDDCLEGWKRASANFDTMTAQTWRCVEITKRWEVICDSLKRALKGKVQRLRPNEFFIIPGTEEKLPLIIDTSFRFDSIKKIDLSTK